MRRWKTRKQEGRLADAEQKCQSVIASLRGIPGLKAKLITNVIGHHAYGVNLEVDPAVAGMTVFDVVTRLKEGDPPVWTRVRDGEDFITIHAFGMNPGEDKIIGERIAALFGK